MPRNPLGGTGQERHREPVAEQQRGDDRDLLLERGPEVRAAPAHMYARPMRCSTPMMRQ